MLGTAGARGIMDVMDAPVKTRARKASPPAATPAAPPAVAPAAVKSAQRVLEVLELFAERQAPATVTEIASALGYPQSSTSMLVASLEALGYLQQDRATRRYHPTLRVMLLGTWLHDGLFAEGSLLASMEQLRLRTRSAVLIGLRQGIHVRFILSLPSAHPNALHYPVGVIRPVCRSAAGKALLARETDAEVARIARRANAEADASDPADRVDVPALLDEIRQVRAQGWAESSDYPKPGRVTLAIQVPPLQGQPAMALALGARKDTIGQRRPALLAALAEASQRLQHRDA